MTGVRAWLQGKKTYVLAGLLLALTLALVWTGRMTPAWAMTLIAVAACGLPVTFKASLERHRATELELLEEIAESGTALAAHNSAALEAGLQRIYNTGSALVGECQEEAKV